ncbi:MAG: hypothetical protein ABFQ82_00715 [Thermodesulfobacteriota bacterium]
MGKGHTFITLLLAGALVLLAMAGCAKERVYEGIYEGVRMQDQAEQHSDDPDKMPGYDEYRKERLEIIEERSEQ